METVFLQLFQSLLVTHWQICYRVSAFWQFPQRNLDTYTYSTYLLVPHDHLITLWSIRQMILDNIWRHLLCKRVAPLTGKEVTLFQYFSKVQQTKILIQ